jgi:hypothetical protein
VSAASHVTAREYPPISAVILVDCLVRGYRAELADLCEAIEPPRSTLYPMTVSGVSVTYWDVP